MAVVDEVRLHQAVQARELLRVGDGGVGLAGLDVLLHVDAALVDGAHPDVEVEHAGGARRREPRSRPARRARRRRASRGRAAWIAWSVLLVDLVAGLARAGELVDGFAGGVEVLGLDGLEGPRGEFAACGGRSRRRRPSPASRRSATRCGRRSRRASAHRRPRPGRPSARRWSPGSWPCRRCRASGRRRRRTCAHSAAPARASWATSGEEGLLAEVHARQARISLMTSPNTVVGRSWRPWYWNVTLRLSRPSRCRMVACRS